MKINLICPKEHRPVLKELLKSRNVEIDDNAKVHISVKGEPLPDNGITIVFDPEKNNELIEFLDTCFSLKKQPDNNELLLPGKTAHGFKLIPVNEISYFKAEGNYIYALVKGKFLEVNKKLYELENTYHDKGFIRISKSYIINILGVKEIIPWFSGKLILKLKDQKLELEVSRNYVKDFKKFIGIGKPNE